MSMQVSLVRFWLLLPFLWAAQQNHATTISIAPGSRALLVQIGSGGGTINKVTFTLTAANVGNGVAVVGTPAILVNVAARDTVLRTVQLVVNSSVPLSNGASTLPFSQISWTTSDASIPAGTFSGAAGQLIVTFPTNFQLFNDHTFRYANTQVLQPGTYNGRVTYTVTMP
jgi:hypothetical protein